MGSRCHQDVKSIAIIVACLRSTESSSSFHRKLNGHEHPSKCKWFTFNSRKFNLLTRVILPKMQKQKINRYKQSPLKENLNWKKCYLWRKVSWCSWCLPIFPNTWMDFLFIISLPTRFGSLILHSFVWVCSDYTHNVIQHLAHFHAKIGFVNNENLCFRCTLWRRIWIENIWIQFDSFSVGAVQCRIFIHCICIFT